MFLANSHTIPYLSSEISVVIDKSIKQTNKKFRTTACSSYVGHLESKERLRIQPAQLLHRTRLVVWCVQ
jgi:hypothetical protein